MAECPTCGDSHFKSERGMRYHHATVHDEKLRDEYTCSNCGEIFTKLPSQMTDSDTQFCSDQCMGKWMERNKSGSDSPAWEGGTTTFTCIVCDKKFERYEVNETPSNKHYCSSECFGEWVSENNIGEDHPNWNGGKIVVNCEWCNNSLQRKPSDLEKNSHHFCDYNCQGKWRSEYKTGEDAFNWRGGCKNYYGEKWYSQRRKAIDRDNEQCQDCGMNRDQHYDEHGSDLEVHHKIPIRTFNDTAEANKLDNLVTLCVNCHIKREKG